ncbi:acetamidase/formamidase family protein [Ancylobacter oerskovii]|uniref:Acetamidase/formamidase family protein n=1 Tax=Ancylobacter oerskovii TaxID=459519 RepID=A0ABW4Z3X6_9HYPH|nr:acetamidase/formamidase family protein [Ancylobacter oerskovii]MBS7545869.1 acetamidase/formamidase family protein [Ancylobacter oerskovii]
MAEHYLPAQPGTVNWGQWDAKLKPALTIRSGDRVVIDTLSGEPEDMPDFAATGFTPVPGQAEVFAATFRGPGPHMLTGPIFVEGAEPGDVLEVRLLDIAFRADWGWNIQMPFLGTLPEDFPSLRRIHFPVDGAKGVARMPWGQELPLDPFFGNFGVAPAPGWGRLSSTEPRVFGGNMDNKELGVGTTSYFPVFAPGALFSVGDGHGRQGDGEVCLTAIETALTGTFEFHVRKDMKLTTPRAEKPDEWITMGFDVDLDDAVKEALRDMIVLISEHSGLSAQDAYTLCSLCADLRVTQTVDGNKGIHCVLPKRFLPARR